MVACLCKHGKISRHLSARGSPHTERGKPAAKKKTRKCVKITGEAPIYRGSSFTRRNSRENPARGRGISHGAIHFVAAAHLTAPAFFAAPFISLLRDSFRSIAAGSYSAHLLVGGGSSRLPSRVLGVFAFLAMITTRLGGFTILTVATTRFGGRAIFTAVAARSGGLTFFALTPAFLRALSHRTVEGLVVGQHRHIIHWQLGRAYAAGVTIFSGMRIRSKAGPLFGRVARTFWGAVGQVHRRRFGWRE